MALTVRRAAFLDKDGTLVRDLPYNVDPRRIELAPGAGAALRLLRRHGFALYVVSNQPGVAFGRFEESALAALGAHLRALLAAQGVALDGFAWCPHHPRGTQAPYARQCACRKPAPGMLLTAARTHGYRLDRSWMIGDILDDVEAGRRAGCRSALVDNGNETEWRPGPLRTPHLRAPGLAAVARAILRYEEDANSAGAA